MNALGDGRNLRAWRRGRFAPKLSSYSDRTRGNLMGRFKPDYGRSTALLLSGFVVTLISCSAGPADTEHGPTDVRQAISGGEPDYEHHGVVALFMHSGPESVGLCTGTLLAPNLVLTARHCVTKNVSDGSVVCGQAPLDDLVAADAIFVTPEANAGNAVNWFRGAEVIVPSEGSDTCGFDVALLRLEGAGVPARLATAHVPRIDRAPAAGERYTAIGYGQTGDSERSGLRQQRTGLTIQCEPGSCGGSVRAREFLGETGICQGDSGGPALDAADKVVGVVSRGTSGCDWPVYGAVSHWRDWILRHAAAAADAGGYEAALWVRTGRSDAEPGGAAGAGAGGAAAGGSAQGQACSAQAGCPEGFACFYEGGDPSAAFCTATCASGCGAGFTCAADLGVCTAVANEGTPDEGLSESGGCAVAPGEPGQNLVWSIVGLATAVSLARRRRR